MTNKQSDREPVERTVFDDLLQGSDEWVDARLGILTASTIGQLVTPSTVKPAKNDRQRGLYGTLFAERVTGRVEPVFQTPAMLRGHEDEPVARDYYAALNLVNVDEVGFIRAEGDGFTLGYSPDGLVGDDGLIEIKSRSPQRQVATIMADAVPRENMAQLQAGLLVSGREWIDYVSYSAGLPLFVKRVLPDPRWQETLVGVATAFEEWVTERTALWEEITAEMPATKYVEGQF